MIKPDFFDDPDIAELSPLARLFFIGLWTEADREGRLVDDTRRLKARLFPYEAVDVEALAVELHGKDLVRRYADENCKRFFWIRSFTKHQRPHPKEPQSVNPPWTPENAKKHGEPWKNTEGTSESGSLLNGTRNLDSGKRNGAKNAPRSGNGVVTPLSADSIKTAAIFKKAEEQENRRRVRFR